MRARSRSATGHCTLALLDLHRHRRRQAHGDDRAGRQRGGVAIAGHDDGGAAGRAGRAADDRALLAADHRAEDRAADRGAADLARAVAGRRVALAEDRVGADRQLACRRRAPACGTERRGARAPSPCRRARPA